MTFSASNHSVQLLVLALLTSLSISSCTGSTVSQENTTSDTTETEIQTESAESEETSALPEMDWHGKQFRVLGYAHDRTQFSNFEIDADGETGEVVNDAIFRRNTKIEDTYNVEIVQILDSSDTNWSYATTKHIRATVLANEDLYDLAFAPVDKIGTLAREGMFYDLNTVEYIDFSRSWWNPEVNAALEVSNRLFFTNSDFSLRDKNRAYILVFNKELAKDYNLGDPFQLVEEGKWTIDVVRTWAETVAGDVNGNGSVDFDDRFGLGADSYNAFRALAAGCGIEILSNDNGVRELIMNSEKTINIIDKALAIFSTEYVGTTCEKWSGKVDFDFWSTSSKLFKEGRLLFVTAFPHSLKTYSAECVDDYGILPFGKYDEAQEKYYTLADPLGMLFGIPSTTPEPDFSGFMLEALSCEAQKTSLPAYYEITCKTKYTYDAQSAEMLDIAFGGIVFDPAMVYGIRGVSTLLYELPQKGTNDFVSRYQSIESKATTDLEKLVEDIESLD